MSQLSSRALVKGRLRSADDFRGRLAQSGTHLGYII